MTLFPRFKISMKRILMLVKHWENFGPLHNLGKLGIEKILIKYWCSANIERTLREDPFSYVTNNNWFKVHVRQRDSSNLEENSLGKPPSVWGGSQVQSFYLIFSHITDYTCHLRCYTTGSENFLSCAILLNQLAVEFFVWSRISTSRCLTRNIYR